MGTKDPMPWEARAFIWLAAIFAAAFTIQGVL
jgi:hypothetical protein